MSNQNIEKRELPDWRKKAQYRKDNKGWLKYSGKIALRILSALEDRTDLNQKKLADLTGVSPQQISKVVKGEENLTLKSIAKFSEILCTELIIFPDYKYYNSPNTIIAFQINSQYLIINVALTNVMYFSADSDVISFSPTHVTTTLNSHIIQI